VCSGGRPLAATNCLNFGNPEHPEVMWQFSEVIDGMTEACSFFNTPITGGNVSFYNETLGKSIYPTPIIGVLGLLDDASRVLKIAFRSSADTIVLLDASAPDSPDAGSLAGPSPAREFSSSEYSKTIAQTVAGGPPAIDLAAEKRLIDCLVAVASAGVASSCHDISDGGLAVSVAESCFAAPAGGEQPAPRLGATIAVRAAGPAESALFGERGARAIASVSPRNIAALRTIAAQYGVAADPLGQVTGDGRLRIQYDGGAVVDAAVETLREIWAGSLERTLFTK